MTQQINQHSLLPVSQTPSSEGPSARGMIKKILPRFLSTKPAPETRSPEVEKHKASITDVQKNFHTLPIHREPFIWPKNPQNMVSASRHNMSGLESVPEGSQVYLTEESLGLVGESSTSPYGSAAARPIKVLYPEEPVTAGTGISSRSSNYADVPSRLPRYPPGYSPRA